MVVRMGHGAWRPQTPRSLTQKKLICKRAVVRRVELGRRSRSEYFLVNTFLESFTMNVPTVMFWNPNHWELRDSAFPFFDMLKDVGILHDTPESAAEHVNAIWEDVDFWWESEILQETLKSFKKRYSHIPKDGIVNQVSYALKEATLISKNLKKC